MTTETERSRQRAIDHGFIRQESEATSLTTKLKEVPKILQNDNTIIENVSVEQLQRIKRIHKQFSEGSKFSFNFNTLLLVASIIAGLGLVNNSATTIIASMLVSPIMGPVVGMAYGATIRDWRLCRRALYTELISLLVCIASGVMIGLMTGSTALANNWPNEEMLGRASWLNLAVGLPIAFCSGLGVAVGLLDEQTSSLVGVAISASLLPPAVNCGILWVAQIFKDTNTLGEFPPPVQIPEYENLEEAVNRLTPAPTGPPSGTGSSLNDYDSWQFWVGGSISLLLTVSNIILIIVSSILMFRMKERLPIQKNIFWDDLGVARKVYRNLAYMEDDSNINKDDETNLEEGQYTKQNGPDVKEEEEDVVARN